MDKIIIPGVAEAPLHYTFTSGQQNHIHLEVGSFAIADSGKLELVIALMLDKPHTELHLTCSVITHSGQQHSIKTVQTHTAANTSSSVKIRAVVYDKAFHSYHATIDLQPESINADAQQENKIVVLGQAQIVSEPTLVIAHNQVNCGHGTAIGQLDVDQLQTLQFRGINKEKAEKILITYMLL